MVYRGRESSMMNFLRIELLWALLFIGVLQASVHNDQKNITAGQNVTLTCRTQDNNIDLVEWSRADLGDEYVLMYRHGNFHPDEQHPSFKNRVDLQDRQMKDGDVSLILKYVTTADSGTYKCRVIQKAKNGLTLLCNITLSVDPPGQTGGHTEDGGKEDGGKEDGEKEAGGKDDGSVGLVIGLSIVAVAVVFSAAVVLILIYRKHKQCNQDSHPPPAEPQIEMPESILKSESPAAEYNDRNDLEANNCHDQSTRIPDVTLTLENELLHPPPQETAGLLPETDIRVQ